MSYEIFDFNRNMSLSPLCPVSKVLEKHRATFEFEVNEDDVEGRWLRNGVEIQFSVEERFHYVAIRKLHRLTISETYRSDAGEYTFIAGKNRSTMNLRVNSKDGNHTHTHTDSKTCLCGCLNTDLVGLACSP